MPSPLEIAGAIAFVLVPGAVLAWVVGAFLVEHRRDRIPILLYHRLIRRADAEAGRVPDDEMIFVSYDTSFAEQMRYLAEHGFQTLDMDDYLEIRSGRRPRPERAVAITFDDGYESNHTLAFPALRRHGLKATIYVAPEPDAHTRSLVEGVDGFLDADQMRELAAHGVAIQSHTLTHCVLSALDDDTARYELTESRRRLAEITGKPVEHIAVPRAGYSRRIRRLVAETGYRTACCNNKGSSSGLSDPLALPRIVIERDMTVADFARALEPRSAAMLRVVGGIKRIPERIGGAGFAAVVRRRLYGSAFASLFETRNLKRAVALSGAVYLGMSAVFWWHVLGS